MIPLVPPLNTPNGTHTMQLDNPLDQTQEPTELELLKERAALMGIKHSNNITVETLRKKIEDKMEGKDEQLEEAPVEASSNPLAGLTTEQVEELTEDKPVGPTPTLAQYLGMQAKKLIRIRISSMDPKKQDLKGEIFTVANEHIGTIKKYVPFGEQTDNGYHVEQCILDFLRTRTFLHIQTRTVNGQIETKYRYVNEFAIEVLEPLTRAELAALAADQRATGRLEAED